MSMDRISRKKTGLYVTAGSPLLALLLTPLAAIAQASEWQVNGSNTVRVEDYDISGNAAASPYQFEGDHYYDEFNINVTRRFSAFESFRGQLYGVANKSDYRFNDDGLNAERVSLFYENGEGGLPYRVEGGDFYSYLSYRTVQRSMKGTQLELQSRSENGAARHSVILFAGANQAQWDDFDLDDDSSAGASWLIEDGELGSVSVNLVYNQADSQLNLLDREQWVASVAGETNFTVGTHNLNLEGEYAYFDGDHDGDFSAEQGQNRDDTGIFTEVVGNAYRALSYRLRFEEYGYDYRPRGSVVVNDRRSYEGHVGWQFQGGVGLRGRIQTYEDRFDSINQLDTEIIGAELNGNFLATFLPQASGRIRAYRENVSDEFGDTDRNNKILDFNISSPFSDNITAALNFRWLDQTDDLDGRNDATTNEVGFEVNHRLKLGNFSGSIIPGIHFRDIDGGSGESRDWTPTLAVNLSNDAHTFRASYDFLDQDRSTTAGRDLVSQNLALHYHYTKGQNEFGLDVNLHDRDLNVGEDTDARRLSAYWTYYIDKRSNKTFVPQGGTRLDPSASLDGSLPLEPELLTRLAPGQIVTDITAKLSASDAPNPALLADAVVYEMRLLNTVNQRQRLAVARTGSLVDKVGLIIDIERDGRPQQVEQLFEEVREDLIRKFGRPSRNYERGEFTPSYSTQVNTGQLIRVAEWDTNQGVLRFGIPRRLDGEVRMEVQHASFFSEARDTLWSIEAVR